jgi:Fungal specific transcription factor domain
MLPYHPDFTTALEATVLAICTAKLGRRNNDPALVHESLKFYIQGLWELQRALYNPDLMYKDETAASCMALVGYEVMECPDRTTAAWVKHVQGCAKLFELRGPKAYSSEFGHQLFLAFREMEVRPALIYFLFVECLHRR